MGKGFDAHLRGQVQGKHGHLALDACLFFDLGNGLATLADGSASYLETNDNHRSVCVCERERTIKCIEGKGELKKGVYEN